MHKRAQLLKIKFLVYCIAVHVNFKLFQTNYESDGSQIYASSSEPSSIQIPPANY